MRDIVYGDFEWDEEKARRNLRRHGISFEERVTGLTIRYSFPMRAKIIPSRRSDMLSLGSRIKTACW